jgi:hypothetical protein
MLIFQLNFLPVVVGALFIIILGAVWYSKILFGNKWMEYLGITMNDIEFSNISMVKSYVITIISAFVTSYIMSVFINSLGIRDFFTGCLVGLLLWLALTLSRELKNLSWNDKPLGLIMIDSGYDLLYSVLVGGILAVWY